MRMFLESSIAAEELCMFLDSFIEAEELFRRLKVAGIRVKIFQKIL